MTVDINNESGLEADSTGLVRLATFALGQLRIHPQAELSILLVDEPTMSAYHEKYMGEPGPTDVLSFPMDELRPPDDDEDEPPAGMLGDVVLCPVDHRRAGPRARAHGAGRGRVPARARPPAPARLRPRRRGGAAPRCSASRTASSPAWELDRPDRPHGRSGPMSSSRLGPARRRPRPRDPGGPAGRGRGGPELDLQGARRPAVRGGPSRAPPGCASSPTTRPPT